MDTYTVEYRVKFRIDTESMLDAIAATTKVLVDLSMLDDTDHTDPVVASFNAFLSTLEVEDVD